MSKTANKVLLFEDNPIALREIGDAIQEGLPRNAKLIPFNPSTASSDKPYEDRIRNELKSKKYENTTLIVSDRDLSRTQNYPGLSEVVVSKIAAELAIPICLYARGFKDDLFERQRSWGDGRIILDSEPVAGMAAKVSVLVSGFVELQNKLNKVLSKKGKNRPQSPAAVMAEALGKPELADQISLYGSGDQKMVAEILPFVEKGKRKELEKRLPSLFGYWLYDSILRFPGLLVNSVAAASYLNIEVATFTSDNKLKKLFEAALYDGPFRDSADPIWWRHQLDDILFAEDCKDGQELVQKKLKRKVKPCVCSVDPKKRAGWYCVATKQPVSLENSRGNISWFPPGADLARVRNDVFDEIGPWLGMY